jgi:hypothetical protein
VGTPCAFDPSARAAPHPRQCLPVTLNYSLNAGKALLEVFQRHHRHHLHLRVQSKEKPFGDLHDLRRRSHVHDYEASALASLWEEVGRFWLQFLPNLLKTFSTFPLRIASLRVPTGNVNLIITRMVSPFVASYDFGAVRVATFALLTFTTLSGSRSCGVVIATFSGPRSAWMCQRLW